MNSIVAVFPGQGAQYVGMGKYFYDNFLVARKIYEKADQILDMEFSKLCFEGPVSKLFQYQNMFPAILTTSYAIYQVFLEEFGVKPDYFIGHSLGEYGALVASGILSFKDALKIVRVRGQISDRASDHGTMSIVEGIDESMLKELCERAGGEGQVSISCFNGAKQMAVSGSNDSVELLTKMAREQGAMVTPLIGSGPMHSINMTPYKQEFAEYLRQFSFIEGEYNVISNVTGKPIGAVKQEDMYRLLTEHILQPVKWTKSIEYLSRYEAPVFVEMGAKAYMNRLIENLVPSAKNYCYGVKSDQTELKQDVILENHKKYSADVISDMIKIAVSEIPIKKEDYKKETVKENVKKLKAIKEEYGTKQDREEAEKEALELFCAVLKEKGCDSSEIKYWQQQLNSCE